MQHSPLERRFHALGRRILALRGMTGLGWGIVVAVVVVLGFVWLDLLWELTPPVRIAASGLAALAAIAVLGIAMVRARREGRPAVLAERVDRAAIAGGEIRSGYDLSLGAPGNGAATAAAPLTRGLAELAVDRAVRLASVVQGWRIATARPVVVVAGVIVTLAATLVGIGFLLPELAQTQWLRFSDPFGDHPPYSQIRFSVEPGNTQVVYGRGLEVKVATDGPPVERLDLVIRGQGSEDEETLPMFPETSGHWRGVLTKVTSPGAYYVRAGRARSRRFEMGVITVPRIESVRLRITPPAYTRHPPYEGPLPQGGLVGLPGTKVQIWATSNRPLARGQLEVAAEKDKSRIELKPLKEAAETATGSFEIRTAGRLELGLTDISGHASDDKFAASITLLKDESPFIRIVNPPKLSLATPEATLPVTLSGEDDYGISKVQLYRSLNDSRALPLDFTIAKPPATRFDGTEPLPLSAYGLEPGDVIKLFARIEDNDPAGAKGFEAPVVEVRIISQQQFEQMLREREGLEVLMSKYREAQRRLEALNEQQDGLRKKAREAGDGKVPDSSRDDLQKLAQQLRNEAKEIRRSAEHLLPYDIDHKLSKQLEQIAESLEKQAGEIEDLQSLPSISAEQLKRLLDKLGEQLGGERKELGEKVLIPLELLEQLYPLIEDQARFVELYEQQRDLAERLAALKGHDREDNPLEKARMRDLEAQQRRLREQLSQLLDDIDDHVKRLPEDSQLDELRTSAREFVEAAKSGGAIEAMTEAEAGLTEFSGTRGHAGAQKAADLLEKLLSKCESMQGQGRACLKFKPGLSAMLGATIEQLLGEAGLGSQPGGGNGRGGSSMRRDSSSNVGLFGQMPGMGEPRANRRRGNEPGNGVAADRESNTANTAPGVNAQGDLRATGAGGVQIPARYRSRVSAYLQRIIEEGNDEPNRR